MIKTESPAILFVFAECGPCFGHWAVVRPRREMPGLLYFDRTRRVLDTEHPDYTVESDNLICPQCGRDLVRARLGIRTEDGEWIQPTGDPFKALAN